MFFLLLVLLSLVHAGGPPTYPKACPKLGADDLLPCIQRLLDGDDDGTITTDELDAFLDAQPPFAKRDVEVPRGAPAPINPPFECLPDGWKGAFLTSASIMTMCDADSSGNLTIADWQHANGCFKTSARRMSLCIMCEKCLALL